MEAQREQLRGWLRRWRAVEDDRLLRLGTLDEAQARAQMLDVLDRAVPPARDEDSGLLDVQAVFTAWAIRSHS